MTGATWLIASPAGGPGWMAAGDAVCALDPSWGRGIIWALETGETAGRLAGACLTVDAVRRLDIEVSYRNYIHTRALGEVAELASRTAGFDLADWLRRTGDVRAPLARHYLPPWTDRGLLPVLTGGLA